MRRLLGVSRFAVSILSQDFSRRAFSSFAAQRKSMEVAQTLEEAAERLGAVGRSLIEASAGFSKTGKIFSESIHDNLSGASSGFRNLEVALRSINSTVEALTKQEGKLSKSFEDLSGTVRGLSKKHDTVDAAIQETSERLKVLSDTEVPRLVADLKQLKKKADPLDKKIVNMQFSLGLLTVGTGAIFFLGIYLKVRSEVLFKEQLVFESQLKVMKEEMENSFDLIKTEKAVLLEKLSQSSSEIKVLEREMKLTFGSISPYHMHEHWKEEFQAFIAKIKVEYGLAQGVVESLESKLKELDKNIQVRYKVLEDSSPEKFVSVLLSQLSQEQMRLLVKYNNSFSGYRLFSFFYLSRGYAHKNKIQAIEKLKEEISKKTPENRSELTFTEETKALVKNAYNFWPETGDRTEHAFRKWTLKGTLGINSYSI